MSNFVKEKHIELSDGDTYIVANDKCPLTEEQADELGIIVETELHKKTPCCACTASLIDQDVDFICPNYFGYINSSNKGEFFDCRISIIFEK